MEQSDLTAIIPIFNEEAYVARAIESVLSQTVRPRQILIVDDGSTDNSAAVVKRYSADGVEYVYQDNGGLASARNKGIANSRCTYVGFLDADDEWKPVHVANVTKLFQEHPHLAWACAPYEKVFENGEVDFVRSIASGVAHNGLIKDYFTAEVRFHFTLPSSMFIKRSVFDHVGTFDTSISEYGEDQDMWFRIGLSYPEIGYTGQVGTVYWHREGSLMNMKPRDVNRALTRIHKTESHAMYRGREKLTQCEPLILEWVLYEMKEAAVHGDRSALKHISNYYGRRLSIRKRLLLSLFRVVRFRIVWQAARKLYGTSKTIFKGAR